MGVVKLLGLLLFFTAGQAILEDESSSIVVDTKFNIKYKNLPAWKDWKVMHLKSYNNTREELLRHLIWLSNMKYITQHNANSHIFGFTLAMNHLGDLTESEYMAKYYCYSGVTQEQRSKLRGTILEFEPPPSINSSSFPDSLDWRSKGAVGSVKNQWFGVCGSCYAFSAMGALEGASALAKGYFVSLSEQNIVDCSVPYGNYGCSGGNMYNSFMYVIANDGVDTENSYPYIGRQQGCSYSSMYTGASQRGIIAIKSGDEAALLSAVYYMGPVAVAVDGRSNAFKYYYSGVFDSSRCTSNYLTHSLLVTGYGTYQGKDYFLVKNSWGQNWGMDGYILMTRNSYNQCGIASDASFPTL